MNRKPLCLVGVLFTFLSGSALATESAPLTGGSVSHRTETVSTASVTVLPSNGARKFLQIQNTSIANTLACTLDGSTPIVNGNGIQMLPSGSATYDVYVPTGAVNCIGSASSTTLTITYQ